MIINGGIPRPTNIDFDGRIRITDDPDANFYLGKGNTPNDSIDLYSVVIHEAAHLLGFASLIDTTGFEDGFITLWDQFLHFTPQYFTNGETKESFPLLLSNCQDNCWFLNDSIFKNFAEVDSALRKNCSTQGDYDFIFGSEGIAPIFGGVLNTNNLSHLNPMCNDEDIPYVMQRYLEPVFPDNQRRTFTQPEKDILCKLGYKLNDYCDGCFITAASEPVIYFDGIYYNPLYYTCAGDSLTVNFSEFLCNDFSNGDIPEITSWHAPSGITVVMNDSAFTFYSTVVRTFQIIYTLKGCDCVLKSGALFVQIGDCYDCSQIDPCENLTCVDGFEQFTPQAVSYTIQKQLSDGDYWVYNFNETNSNTVDVCLDSDLNTYVNLAGYENNLEGLCLKLSEPIDSGCLMIINLRAAGRIDSTKIRIHVSQYPPCSFTDTRVNTECGIPTNCEDYVFNPICIGDDITVATSTSGGVMCVSSPNLQPIEELKWRNNKPFPINYVIFSTNTIETSLRLDDIQIRKECIDPGFEFSIPGVCNEVYFSAISQDSTLIHFWDFGDDSTSTENNPVHIYLTADTFMVTHIVIDDCENQDTASLQVVASGLGNSCCPDTTLSVSTTWTGTAPHQGRFHTITVEKGVAFTVDDDIELQFCEGGALVIEPGAYVDLEGDLTSFGDMTWKGVFVSGDSTLSQAIDFGSGGFHGLQQGFLQTRTGASIKNAEIAIRNYGLAGSSSSGGMVRGEEIIFKNNTIGIDFIKYQNFNEGDTTPLNSLGSFTGCSFYTDSTYHLQNPFYAFARLSKIDGLDFKSCKFVNSLPPENPSEYADFGFGIHAIDAYFKVQPSIFHGGVGPCPLPCNLTDSTLFSGLGHGIYVMTDKQTKPYSVYHSLFENCFRGITDMTNGGGTILFSTFKLGKVPAPFSVGQIGAEFHFAHNGFTLQENLFIMPEEHTQVIPIGVLCNDLGEFDNEIRRNTFTGVQIANQAIGVNLDTNIVVPRGLVYLCNTIEETPSYGYDFHIPDSPADDLINTFQTPGSSQGSSVSAGNHFSYTAQDFMNYGEGDINYFYYPPGYHEEPRDSFSLHISSAFGTVNSCAVEYCAPPCHDDMEEAKDDYFTHISSYESKLEDYLTAISSHNQQKIDSTRSKAIYFQRLASKDLYSIITQMMLDSSEYNNDSLISWIGRLDTYGAEVMIAGEYGARGDYEAALDVLETIASRRDLSPRQENDLSNLIDIYLLLSETPITSFTSENREFLRNIAYSNIGRSSGMARALLSNFKEYIPLPYYDGERIKFRESDVDSIHEARPLSEVSPLKIYPNPAGDFIIIDWQTKIFQPKYISVFNMVGEKITESNDVLMPFLRIEVRNWSEGVYLVVAQDASGKVVNNKFIKISAND